MRPATLAAAAVALAMGIGVYFRRSTMTPEQPARAEPTEPAPSRGPLAEWCAPGYQPIPGGCLAVPAAPVHTPLLIYLHGRYEEGQSAEETDRQRRVAARSTLKGFAVLALRGTLGACGLAGLSNWYCWPSNDRTAAAAEGVVASWQGALAEADERVHPERRFVLGFSNGGYFATLLASRGLVRADAYVIAHAGPVDPVAASTGTPPLLLLSADDDVAQDDMLRLQWELTKLHWPHDAYARAGAHGLTDQDIDAALAFATRFSEPLPLDPPIKGLHRPSHHAHDAGGSLSDASSEETPDVEDL